MHNDSSHLLAEGAFVPEGGDNAVSEHTPLFYLPDLQQLAQQNNLRLLAEAVRSSEHLITVRSVGNGAPNPLIFPGMPTRFTPKSLDIRKQTASGLEETLESASLGSGAGLRTAAHLQSCPLLWICGHLCARHSYPRLSALAGPQTGTLDTEELRQAQAEFEQFGGRCRTRSATHATTTPPPESVAPP